MRKDSAIIDATDGLIHFLHMTMEIKTASSETTAKLQTVTTDDALTIAPRIIKTITAFVDHPPEWNITGTMIPFEKFTETANLLISHSLSTIVDKRKAVRVTNTIESPYLIKKNSQIADLSIVTPE